MAEPLRVVDPATGELVAPGCRACHELTSRLAGAEEDLQNVQEENKRLLRAVKAMRRKAADERLRHRRRTEVEAIFTDWQDTCGKHRSKLSAERFDVIVARLNEGYTAEHFRLAAFGAEHANPWGEKPGRDRMVEIATFAREGKWLEQFAKAGHVAKRAA